MGGGIAQLSCACLVHKRPGFHPYDWKKIHNTLLLRIVILLCSGSQQLFLQSETLYPLANNSPFPPSLPRFLSLSVFSYFFKDNPFAKMYENNLYCNGTRSHFTIVLIYNFRNSFSFVGRCKENENNKVNCVVRFLFIQPFLLTSLTLPLRCGRIICGGPSKPEMVSGCGMLCKLCLRVQIPMVAN